MNLIRVGDYAIQLDNLTYSEYQAPGHGQRGALTLHFASECADRLPLVIWDEDAAMLQDVLIELAADLRAWHGAYRAALAERSGRGGVDHELIRRVMRPTPVPAGPVRREPQPLRSVWPGPGDER